MAKPAKKDQPQFRETMGAYAPTGFAYAQTDTPAKPAKNVAWTEIIIGAVCLVLGFGLGLYLIKPPSARVAAVVTPSANVATFGAASDGLKADQMPLPATTSATTLQPGQSVGDLQSATTKLQPQLSSTTLLGTISGAQLQGSYNAPVATR